MGIRWAISTVVRSYSFDKLLSSYFAMFAQTDARSRLGISPVPCA
jgi:hypothetical protein